MSTVIGKRTLQRVLAWDYSTSLITYCSYDQTFRLDEGRPAEIFMCIKVAYRWILYGVEGLPEPKIQQTYIFLFRGSIEILIS